MKNSYHCQAKNIQSGKQIVYIQDRKNNAHDKRFQHNFKSV